MGWGQDGWQTIKQEREERKGHRDDGIVCCLAVNSVPREATLNGVFSGWAREIEREREGEKKSDRERRRAR